MSYNEVEFEPLAPVELDSDANPANWNTKAVVDWLTAMRLQEHAQNFRAQRITGDVLPLLSEDHLKELGVTIIGERVALLAAIGKLRHGAANRHRFRILWEENAQIYTTGPCGWIGSQCCCVPCCEDPDHYKLTGSTLVVIEVDKKTYNSLCCTTSKVTRNIDLSTIAGVTAIHASSLCDCGCAADEVHVQLNSELGLDEVRPLKIKKGEGDRVTKLIQSALEDAQMLNAASKPGQQIMGRI